MIRDFLWVEKFAPETIQQCILPPHVKNTMEGIVNSGNLQNMIFHSSPGTGKTTCGIVACEQIGAEYIVINGSDEGRLLDTARDRVKRHASMISMTNPDAPKVVIYDEFDNTTTDVQKLLRGLINEFQDSCRFIFTCNSLAKVIEPIHSRCTVIDFGISDQSTVAKMMMDFSHRCKDILEKEGVEFDNFKLIAQFVHKNFPDFRKTLNELQSYALSNKKIDAGILTLGTTDLDGLFKAIMNRSYKACREWIADNNIGADIYSELAKHVARVGQPALIGSFTLILSKYQYQDAFAYDRELNASACMLELIGSYNTMGGGKPSTKSKDDPI